MSANDRKPGKGQAAELASLIIPLAEVLHWATGAAGFSERTSFRQIQALMVVSTRGPVTVGEMGKALSIAASTATELADRMEAAGLCRSEPGETDRRRRLIRATPMGQETVAAFRRSVIRVVERQTRRLTSGERSELLNAFRAVIRILGSEEN